jgi:dihydropteroate synthase
MSLPLPGGKVLSLARPVIVGILNLTPDSFSDGGRYLDPAAAVRHARDMLAQGAAVIDIGAESTRPGSAPVAPEEQWRRLAPVIAQLTDSREKGGLSPFSVPFCLSIDTQSALVADKALAAGAAIINDISAGADPRMFESVARRGAAIILMHMQGRPATMQEAPVYGDVAAEVRDFLLGRAAAAQAAGVPRPKIVLDPGLGFGKTVTHNLQLLARLGDLVSEGYPVMLGASRKRFLASLPGALAEAGVVPGALPGAPERRLGGTCAATALGVAAGASLFRVHDVAANRQAADLAWAVAAHHRPAPGAPRA